MSKKIKIDVANMASIAKALGAIKKKDVDVELTVGPQASGDKMGCRIASENGKESVEIGFFVAKPKDASENEPYLDMIVGAEKFLNAVNGLLTLQSDFSLEIKGTMLRLTADTASLDVPLKERSEEEAKQKKLLVYQNQATLFAGRVKVAEMVSAFKRVGTAMGGSYAFSNNVTGSYQDGKITFRATDGTYMQRAELEISGVKESPALTKGADDKTGEGTGTAPYLFALTQSSIAVAESISCGAEEAMFFLNPKQVCLGMKPGENLTVKYTAIVAADTIPPAIANTIAGFENQECEARVVVDGTALKNALRVLSATADTYAAITVRTETEGITLFHEAGKMKLKAVEMDGGEQVEYTLKIDRLIKMLSVEGNGNILLGMIKGDGKSPFVVRSGDLNNSATQVAVVLPFSKVKAEEQKEKKGTKTEKTEIQEGK